MAQHKTQSVKRLDDDERIVAATAILSTLQVGLAKIKIELDSLNIDGHLDAQPQTDRRAEKRWRGGQTSTRNDLLRERRARNRAIVPEIKSDDHVPGDLPRAVTLALEVCAATRSAPAMVDRRALREQRERDKIAVERGVAVQTQVITDLREACKYAQVLADRDPVFAVHVRRLRAYEAAAAVDDELRDIMNSRDAGGFKPWRGDIIPILGERAMVAIGSQRDYNSEVNRMRRDLEEFKKI